MSPCRVAQRHVSIKRATIALMVMLIFSSTPSNAPSAADPAINLVFSVERLDFPPAFFVDELSLECRAWTVQAEALSCPSAILRAANSTLGELTLDVALTWDVANGRYSLHTQTFAALGGSVAFSVSWSRAGRALSLVANGIDVMQLLEVAQQWNSGLADYSATGGSFDLRIDCATDLDDHLSCHTAGELHGIWVEGISVAEDLDGHFNIDFDQSEASAVGGTLTLTAGVLYFEPEFGTQEIPPGFLIEVGQKAIAAEFDFLLPATGGIRIRHLKYTHPGVVDIDFTGGLDLPAMAWTQVSARIVTPALDRMYETYLQPLVLDSPLGNLEVAGHFEAEIYGLNDQVEVATFLFDNIHLDDVDQRFALYGLDGTLLIHAGTEKKTSTVAWQGGAIYNIGVGAGRISFESERLGLNAVDWEDVALLDGKLRIDTLSFERLGSADRKVTLSGALLPVSLIELTHALGWPLMTGRLSGVMPSIIYEQGNVILAGDLNVSVFGGEIVLSEFVMEDLFGLVPSLSANLAIKGLDLAELTQTFSFGNIEGTLDGEVRDLRLEAWQPVSFDASFATPLDDETPHRISRQAVNNLGRLGAGSGAALTTGVLKFIPAYSYGRLGIGCKLRDGYCEISGVKGSTHGEYFLLTRGGLFPPWIDIKGSGRRMAWTTLLKGFDRIAKGESKFKVKYFD